MIDSNDDLQSMLKKYSEAQAEFFKRMGSMQFDTMQSFLSTLQAVTRYSAVFKATVQSNGRITIPEAERQALGISEGDLVQVIIIPMLKGKEAKQ